MMDRNQFPNETIDLINARFRRLKNKAPTENTAELSIALQKGCLLKAYPDYIMEILYRRVAEENDMSVSMLMDLASQIERQRNDVKGIMAQ
ncbi:MAG: hypothetical protein GY928_30035 [Colwellia sp.]|nr:hypothetical protein [Colwellia sp.]